jgi:phosphohistidine phosphatase
MKLYLVRHGEYVPNATGPLSGKGREDIQHLAAAVRCMGMAAANIFHSSKLRAKQTAEILSQALFENQPIELHPGLNPDDSVITFAHEIAALDQDILVVGHFPFMPRLVGFLVVGNENKEVIDFQPGTLACLSKIENDRWIIEWVWRPFP